MNGYNFTDRVRKVLQMAREEAARLHHEYVGTEHILLGLIREGEGVAAAVLTNLNVDLEDIQQKIEETVKKGKAAAAATRTARGRLGVGVDLIPDVGMYTLNKLLVYTQPAHLAVAEGVSPSDPELSVRRAQFVRKVLESEVGRRG